MALAKAKGRLRGKQPNLSKLQRDYLLTMRADGTHTRAEMAEVLGVSRTTSDRELKRAST
jgi:IS30 family transposase